MRNTIVATVAVVFLTTGFVGCKSAPKMPWSKTAATSDVESAALAHTAPSLPADIAKQAEAFASSSPSIDLTTPPAAGGQAAPYSSAPAFSPGMANLAAAPTTMQGSGAKTTPTAYPTTGASPYSTAPASTIAATTPSVPPAFQSTDKSADLGSVDQPYNPSAVPPARTVASVTPAPATPSVSADRYGAGAVASRAPAYSGANPPPTTMAAAPAISGSNRYGTDRYGSVEIAPTSPATSPAQPVSDNLATTKPVAPSTTSTAPAYSAPATTTGDRYAASNTVTPSVAPTTLATTTPANVTPTTPAPVVVASASVYRPGGTTSYAGLGGGQPVAEIASRTKVVEQQVPNVAAPSVSPKPSQAPRYR